MPSRDQIEKLTRAEIQRQQSAYGARRDAITRELVAIETSRRNGNAPSPPPLPLNVRAARERAKAMLNGHAPASLTIPPAISREEDLYIDREAIDLVLHALREDEVVAQAADAVAWAEDHRAEWRALCREIVLAAKRLEALEDRARKLREPCGVGLVHLEMAHTIAQGSVLGIDWGADPLRFALAEALADGIVNVAEIKGNQ